MKTALLLIGTLIICMLSINALAQKTRAGRLFQYGVSDGFVGGLYKSGYTLRQLKKEGDFGIGAPNLIDGELVMNRGKVYQSKSSGETIAAPDSLTTPLAFVCFFRPDVVFHLADPLNEKQLQHTIDSVIANHNGMFAIRVIGRFITVRTRAFPPVTAEPYPALATILDRQRFFNYTDMNGVLIGYKMPAWVAGINIEGFHFHFLSDDLRSGGHVLSMTAADLRIEVMTLSSISVDMPTGKAFRDFPFKGGNTIDLQKVERGN